MPWIPPKTDWTPDDPLTPTTYNRVEKNIQFLKTGLDEHVQDTTSVHGATPDATPNKMVIRDVNGRAQIAVPLEAEDIARLDSITKGQAGLGNVENYGIATQAEAEDGETNEKYMTPLRVAQALGARPVGGGILRTELILTSRTWTAPQSGLYIVTVVGRGGNGSGGGGEGVSNYAGGAGGIAKSILLFTKGDTVSVVINTYSNGYTQFGDLIAYNGQSGSSGSGPGIGGTASGGNILNVTGGSGAGKGGSVGYGIAVSTGGQGGAAVPSRAGPGMEGGEGCLPFFFGTARDGEMSPQGFYAAGAAGTTGGGGGGAGYPGGQGGRGIYGGGAGGNGSGSSASITGSGGGGGGAALGGGGGAAGNIYYGVSGHGGQGGMGGVGGVIVEYVEELRLPAI